jgi:pimeloyl-ACP methyl ester carboxylesterase
MRGPLLLVALLATLVVVVLALPRLGRLARAAQVLDELRRPGPASWLRRATPEPRVSATRLEHGGRAFPADVYRPARDPGTVPLIFVPGLVEAGRDDPRVAPFASLLARAGFTVVVPDLPAFRNLRVHPDHAAELAAAFDAVAARADLAPRGRAGLLGVSYSGGIALLAALDPARAERVAFVAAVGAYADLDTALRFIVTGRDVDEGRARAVRADPYGKLVFLRTFEEFLDSPADSARLEAMAERRFADPAAPVEDLAAGLGERGRLVYDLLERATPDEVPGLIARLPPALAARLDALSPGRRSFAPLRARLYVAHARDDGTFPLSDARRLVAKARPHTRARLIVLTTLQHVEPTPWRRDPIEFLRRDVPDALRLVSWWSALLGERR